MKASSSSSTKPAGQGQQGEFRQQEQPRKEMISKITHEGRTMTLSEAASIMRNSNASPEERSLAASIMGREGGKHSHDHDRDREDARRKKVASS